MTAGLGRRCCHLGLALLLGGISACSYRVVRSGAVDSSIAARIMKGLATLRGIDFVRPVAMEVRSPGALRTHLAQTLDRDYAPSELRDLSLLYAALGLLPPSVDLHEALLKLYTAQVAGFYDPAERTLYLVDPPSSDGGPLVEALQFVIRRDLVGEMLLAHELTHALQDQSSGALAAADDPSNDDRALAIRAVVEGDATLAGFAYMLGGLAEEQLGPLVEQLGAIPGDLADLLPETPRVLRETLVFQYAAGAEFVADAYRRGGWKAVDALLREPPQSTEQVLHPARYFVRPDAPMRIDLGGLDSYREDRAFRLLDENTLGELVTRILFESKLDANRAAQVATGWDGDRYVGFARGEELHVYWYSVWDRETDAEELETALREAFPFAVERRGTRVLVMIGIPEAERDARAAAIWKETKIGVEHRQGDPDQALAAPRS